MSGAPPDFIVSALDKSDQASNTNIGAAWRQLNGNISIRLNKFVVLEGGPNLVLTLFPNKAAPRPAPAPKQRNYEDPRPEEDTPF